MPQLSCLGGPTPILPSLFYTSQEASLKVADLLPQGPVTVEQLQEVEQVVQDVIKRNDVVHMAEVPLMLARSVRGLRAVDEVLTGWQHTSS